ncbi:aminopeptidase N [Neocloeon triangulifer]|uniref:aminopeptidase N n=1 Tax=Neocloeon triangulifer TaxID=2078957 RepID=UPI00286F57CC|nr:aminopeptidase N [Neocloeon triangulifer]
MAKGQGFLALSLTVLLAMVYGGRVPRGADFKAINHRHVDIRLPPGIKPESYFLQLQPFLEQDLFRGHVFINITVTSDLEQRDLITLHAGSKLKLKHVTLDEVYPAGPLAPTTPAPVLDAEETTDLPEEVEEPPTVVSVDREPQGQLLLIKLSKELIPGYSYRLGAEFSGHINNKSSDGIFKGHYVNQVTGNTHFYVAAHFKPSFARTVFPCFDEPEMKAVVTVSIARPKETDLRTISNMPHVSTLPMVNDISWVWDTFEASPPMSTYAISFLTSDLMAGPREEDEIVRVFSRPALAEETEYARRVAPKALDYFEKTLGVRFPLPKLDLVALPGFNAPVPAENWGLVFYREGDILSGGNGYNRWVTSYVVNELVMQWIGSLVTPNWWQDVWMNRALANFLARGAAFQLEPAEEKYSHEQTPAAAVYALYYEYSKRSPYARQPSMKDIISATKAEVVIRMLNFTISQKTFMNTLRDFINDRSYSTYTPEQFWAAIGKRAHSEGTLPLAVSSKAVASTWMNGNRIPLLTVTRDYKGNIDLSQRQFIRDPGFDDDENVEDESLWWIPVIMAPQRPDGRVDIVTKAPALWMPPTKQIENLSDPSEPENFLIVNPEDIGLFLVNYDTQNWKLLGNHLLKEEGRVGPSSIPPTTRAKLLHDSLNLAMAGALDFDTALSMARFLKFERQFEPWHPFFNMVDVLSKRLDGTAAGKYFGRFVLRLASNLDSSLGEAGLPNEPAWRGKLRSNTRHMLCSLGEENCVNKARDVFARWVRSKTPDVNIPVPSRVFCPVFAFGSKEEWNFGFERLGHLTGAKASADRNFLLKTLAGCPRDPAKIEKLLTASLLSKGTKGEPFSESDIRLILGEISGRHAGFTELFRFLKTHWKQLKENFHSRPHLWVALVTAATSNFKTEGELKMVEQFIEEHQGHFGSAVEGALQKSLERVQFEAAWSKKHLDEIENWLAGQMAD